MTPNRIAWTALFAVALVAPTAGATWYAHGTFEPDTTFDANDGLMWTDADKAAGPSRVYFNAYMTNYPTSISPNSGTTNSRVFSPGAMQLHAFLGIWKDCNGDGFMGLGDTGVRDYRADLNLHSTNICGLETRDFDGRPVHNDGKWIREYIPIGMVDPCEHENAAYRSKHCGNIGAFSKNWNVIYSNSTFLWADLAAPGENPRGSCPVRPVPQGTTGGTGGALYTADCAANGRIVNSANAVTSFVDPDDDLQLRFDDPRRPQFSDSRLNVHFPVNLFGNPYNNKSGLLQRFDHTKPWYDPAFTASDCSNPRNDISDPTGAGGRGQLSQVVVKDPTGSTLRPAFGDDDTRYANLTDENGVYVGYYGVKAPGSVSPTGSYWAAAADAFEVVYAPTDVRTTNENAGPGQTGDCKRQTNSSLHDAYPFTLVEADHEPNSITEKLAPSVHFTFFDGVTGATCLAAATCRADLSDLVGGRDWPVDAGVTYMRDGVGGPGWNANAAYVASQGIVNRDQLDFEPSYYISAYARVSTSELTTMGFLMKNTQALKYGAQNCAGGIGPGAAISTGWMCDPSFWHKDSTGKDVRPRYADRNPENPAVLLSAAVGDDYHFRDVDCYDGHLFGGIVYAGFAEHTAKGVCPQP